jgi:hypothetical protein
MEMHLKMLPYQKNHGCREQLRLRKPFPDLTLDSGHNHFGHSPLFLINEILDYEPFVFQDDYVHLFYTWQYSRPALFRRSIH